MKKAIILLIACLAGNTLVAQKCLQLNLASLSSKLDQATPGATSFAACSTRKNDHNQTEIVDYGANEKSLDDFVQKTDLSFQTAQMGGQNTNMQAMAEQMKSMSADQRQAYARQMAAQMSTNAQQPNMNNPDDPENVRMAMQAYTIATTKMALLTNDLASKNRELMDQQKKEEDAIKHPDITKCSPVGKVGLPSCSCANGQDQIYWVQILAIRDAYAMKKNQLVQEYITKLKALAASIDDIVVKLKYGAALNNPQYKKMLAGAQSGAFGNLLSIPEGIVSEARHSGADAFANVQNATAQVYDLDCQR